jgi:hypothetical protein
MALRNNILEIKVVVEKFFAGCMQSEALLQVTWVPEAENPYLMQREFEDSSIIRTIHS